MIQADSTGGGYAIKSQTRYMRLLFLQDMRSKNNPVVRKQIMQGSNKLESVYDSAIAFVYTSYNMTGNRNDLRFDSSGEIDRLLRIYPNVESVIHSYDRPNSKRANMNTTKEGTLLYVTQYYNAFQYRHESVSAHTHDDNVGELRLIMDFSSIQNAGDGLFEPEGRPKAYLIKHNPYSERDLNFERAPENVFSVVEKTVPEKHTLEIKWQIDWKNLNKNNSALQ